MRKIGVFLAVLFVGAAACADPMPAYVGFTLRAPGAQCGLTWILPNNAPPDFYYHGSDSPGFNDVATGSNCASGSAGMFENIIFLNSGGFGLNDFASDYLGPLLYRLTADGVSFRLGVFGLSQDVDPPGYIRAIIDIHAAPEPAPLLLVAGGIAIMGLWRRNRGAKTIGSAGGA